MYVSLNQAAKLFKKSKSNIHTLIGKGKLQWHQQPNGERKLFLPELANLFGSPPEERTEHAIEHATRPAIEHSKNTENAVLVARLEVELTAARSMIETLQSQQRHEREILQSQVEREKANADNWRRMAEESTQIIKALPRPQEQEVPKRKKLFGFLG
jgi:hypothetical protein